MWQQKEMFSPPPGAIATDMPMNVALRRKRLMNGNPASICDGDQRRYVSIPALWYSDDKADFKFGPAITVSGFVGTFKMLPPIGQLEAMKKSHDVRATKNFQQSHTGA
jgi:hypothetical protein